MASVSRAALVAAFLLAQGADARGDEAGVAVERLLAHEALPTGRIGLDLAASTYAQRAEATAEAGARLTPRIAATLGIEADAIATRVRPAGRDLRTTAVLLSRVATTRDGAARLGAALGHVMGARRVLVARLDAQPDAEPDGSGGEVGHVGYVGIGFPVDTLTPALAQGFFEHAAAISGGLSGFYLALGDMMLFLNMRDAEGAPLGGLEDMAFAAKLGQAAGSFPLAQVKIARSGAAEALFVEIDGAAGGSGAHARLLEEDALRGELDALRAEHDALVARLAKRFGWPCAGC